ncbi:hypothetical protein KBC04_03220 [Candidatus Babeliales bacterium]|nr:hypothetical protein [Candidatus Babeliales bacterium]MBP9843938.1 hypothetical protein [Candidatus Babeliales bacterium]
MGTMPVNKNEQNLQENYNLNFNLLEERVIRLVDIVKSLKLANQSLSEENQMLKHQLMKVESSLVAETRDLEELSQEKMMTRMLVDDLIKSIDSLVDQKE